MMKVKQRCLLAVLGLLSILSACRTAGPTVGTAAEERATTQARGRLQPLDEQHAADFRAAFDAAKDHDRYVVALSPT